VSVAAIAPAPAPARPKLLLIGTGLVCGAGTMLFGSMLAFYLARRDKVVRLHQPWVPTGVKIPQISTNIMLISMIGAVVMAQWAVYAIKQNDRQNTYIALGLTAIFGIAVLNAQAYTWIQMKLVVAANTYSVLVYCITGTFFAALVGGVILTGTLAFRTLGGRYSAKDPEGLSAAALYWYFLTAAYAAVWLVVYVTK
jgi:heme/copper-type cytochrome/quinol oxidase subunit 3